MKLYVICLDFIRYMVRKINQPKLQLGNFQEQSTHHSLPRIENYRSKVSIIIPTKDKPALLRSCIESISQAIQSFEIELIVVDNYSQELETKELLRELHSQGAKIIRDPGKFNYSRICNKAAEIATGEFLCFLNNDTQAISDDWLGQMIEHAKQPEVGLVGAVLVFPGGRIQHMGVALGFTGIAGHPFRGELVEDAVPEFCYKISAVTFACAVVSREKYKLIGGLDEKFPVGFNDVDYSIRSTEAGFTNVVCTRARLVHRESQTRSRADSLEGAPQALRDIINILRKYPGRFHDPFFLPKNDI
jgi:O-antigen biosynthesis protein